MLQSKLISAFVAVTAAAATLAFPFEQAAASNIPSELPQTVINELNRLGHDTSGVTATTPSQAKGAAQSESRPKQDKLIEAPIGTLQIAAYGDLDGNRRYTPNAGEGRLMYYKWYAVFGIDGKPIDHAKWCTNAVEPWGGILGGAGRASCRLVAGTYAVQVFNVEPGQFTGPFAEPNNPTGSATQIIQVKDKTQHFAHFGYKIRGGEAKVRAYVDFDGNRTYTPNAGEGSVFALAPYRIVSLVPGASFGKQIDYYRYCANPQANVGGAGRAFCRALPTGLYVVWFDGVNQTPHGPQIPNEFNPNAQNPYIVAVYPEQVSTVDFGYFPLP